MIKPHQIAVGEFYEVPSALLVGLHVAGAVARVNGISTMGRVYGELIDIQANPGDGLLDHFQIPVSDFCMLASIPSTRRCEEPIPGGI